MRMCRCLLALYRNEADASPREEEELKRESTCATKVRCVTSNDEPLLRELFAIICRRHGTACF